jgi:hypothetical protein
MSVAYAMNDLAPSDDGQVDAGAVSVGGGCGNVHPVKLGTDGGPYIDCGTCAPMLVGGHYGWAATPAGVPLSPDELSERELAERDGVAMQRIVLKSVTDSLVAEANAKKGKLGLLDQLKSMSADDRAELLAVIQGESKHEEKVLAAPSKTQRPGAKG